MTSGTAAEWERTAHAALGAGKHRAAREAVLRAASLRAGDARTVAGVVALLAALNLGDALVRYVDGLGPLDRIPVPLLMTIARHFNMLGDQARALKYLDEVHRADPDFPPGLLARAQVLMYFGRTGDARRDLERCLRRAPEIAQAHWLRLKLDPADASAAHVGQMQALMARPGVAAPDRVFLGFAMHAALDALGRHAEAWEALERACRTKRGLLDYHTDDSIRLVDALVAMPGDAATGAAAASGSKTPIFIVGMHRSGTTLLEQLLDASPLVHGAGELYDFTSAVRFAADHHCRGVVDTTIVGRAEGMDLAAVGRHYMESVAWRLGDEPFFVDKLPSNFLNIGFICRALPQARILHMVRDPMETCFSNLRELFSDANPHSYDQQELGDYFLLYRRLMAHWHAAFPGRILDVAYAGLAAEPEVEMRRVAAFCGIEYIPSMADSRRNRGRAVATASAVQVRQRVARAEVAKWMPYRPWLQPLASALEG
ncbi:sulfotransferase [Luteimonas sp. 8-5]|uniref:tetratricopeptide repeat-containing sulfotransferase family protein n=1 Tax=Luteimonas sp. 8-5 TaxID=3039387 RepID=UPI0024367EB2|nr:sulfotransferase [Luteimonas sp. 8-5]MDG6347743.1 sulfotransferase [Luteimonas sp. 8-5]